MNTYTVNSPTFWYLMTLLVVIALWSQGANIVRAYRSKRHERVKAAWLWGALVVALSMIVYFLVLHVVPSLLEEASAVQNLADNLTSDEICHKQLLITVQDVIFLILVLLPSITEMHKAMRSRKRLLIKHAAAQVGIAACLGILLYAIAYICAPSLLFGPYC